MSFISSVVFSSLELWVLYCNPPELDDEGETFYMANYEVMMAKSFPISLRNWESVI